MSHNPNNLVRSPLFPAYEIMKSGSSVQSASSRGTQGNLSDEGHLARIHIEDKNLGSMRVPEEGENLIAECVAFVRDCGVA